MYTLRYKIDVYKFHIHVCMYYIREPKGTRKKIKIEKRIIGESPRQQHVVCLFNICPGFYSLLLLCFGFK